MAKRETHIWATSLFLGLILMALTFMGACAQSSQAPAPAPSPAPKPASPAPVPTAVPNPTVAPASSPAAAKQIKLSLSSISIPTHANSIALSEWAKEIEKATEGRLVITIYPGQSLVKGPDTYKSVVSGVTDIGYALQSFTPGRFPLSAGAEMPFLFTSQEQAASTLWSLYTKFPEIKDEYKDTKILALWAAPANKIISKKQILKLEDLKGVKFSVSGTIAVRITELLGAIAVNLPSQDTYLALSQGVVAGTINSFESSDTNKFYEHLSYYTLPGVAHYGFFVTMNLDSWKALPPDIQKIMEQYTGESLSKRMTKAMSDREVTAQKNLESRGIKGGEFYAAELLKMRDAVKPVISEWLADMKAKNLPGQTILDEITKLTGQQK